MARILFGLMVALVALPASAAEPQVRIGMYQTMFRDVPPAMVVALAKPMQTIFEKTMGVTGSADLVPDVEALAKGIDEKKFDCGVFVGYEFAWVKAKYPDLEPMLCAVPNGGTLKAVVVVHTDNKATKIDDLKNETVLAPARMKAHCELYFNDLRKGLSDTTAKLVSKPTVTADDMLNDLAAGGTGAVLMDESSFAAFKKTNPGSGAALKVIHTSGVFPNAVLVVRKGGMAQDIRTKITEGMTTAHTVPAGKPLMMLWSLKCFETVPEDYQDQLVAIAKLYPEPAVAKKEPVKGTLTSGSGK